MKNYRKPTGWTSGAGQPRWGEASDETQDRRNAWAERVGQTQPTDLKRCSACGGYATRTCTH